MAEREIDAARVLLWNESGSRSHAAVQAETLEQYKLYVELADRVSQRRATANAFFATVNTALIAALAASADGSDVFLAGIVVPLVGITLCYLWAKLLQSYRSLNTAKWKVVGLLEERLSASPWWKAEWAMLGGGQDPRLHTPLTPIEKRVPVAFAALYVLVIARSAYLLV